MMTIQSTVANAINDAVKPLSDDAQRQLRNFSQQTFSPDMLSHVSDDADEERLRDQIPQLPPVVTAPSQASVPPSIYAGGWAIARPVFASLSNAASVAAKEFAEPLTTEGPRVLEEMWHEERNNNSQNRDPAQSPMTLSGFSPNGTIQQGGYPAPMTATVPVPVFNAAPLNPVGQVFNRLV